MTSEEWYMRVGTGYIDIVLIIADLAASEARESALVEALEEYGSHKLLCPLAQWSQGRPTKDGGYETMYAGKWYQGDDQPECTCGFRAALAGRKP